MAVPMSLDNSIDNPILSQLSRRTLRTIRPRMKDRTETLWDGVISVSQNESLFDAFQRLSVNNITTLPVTDNRGRVAGVLSLHHVVSWMTQRFDENSANVTVENLTTALDIMKTTRVSNVFFDSWEASYAIGKNYQTLFTAGKHMAKNKKRVIVTDWQGRPSGIFTLSMLIGEVKNNLKLLPKALKDMKVRDLTKTYWVDSILEDSTVISAFHRMASLGRESLAVVNDAGVVVDELSLKDLKILRSADSFLHLYKTVKQFKKVVRELSGKILPDVVTVTQDTTFEEVIKLMDETPAARVFVCTASKRPLFTLSQTDILQQLFPNSDFTLY